MGKQSFRAFQEAGTLFSVIGADQASKYVLSNHISGGVFQATQNPGIAFNLLSQEGAALYIHVIWLLGIVFLLTLARSHLARIGLLLVASGGVSNLIDRTRMAYVQDIFVIGPLLFNLADVVIAVGAGSAVISFFLKEQPTQGN